MAMLGSKIYKSSSIDEKPQSICGFFVLLASVVILRENTILKQSILKPT
jgi:hypothetical protein